MFTGIITPVVKWVVIAAGVFVIVNTPRIMLDMIVESRVAAATAAASLAAANSQIKLQKQLTDARSIEIEEIRAALKVLRDRETLTAQQIRAAMREAVPLPPEAAPGPVRVRLVNEILAD
jgi:hypothetical protein